MPHIILKSGQQPGDMVMLSAAIRDLKASHPDYWIGVQCNHPDIFLYNPHVCSADEHSGLVIEAEYPIVKRSNELPVHFVSAYRMHLEDVLGISIPQGAFRGDIHLAGHERTDLPAVPGPFWIVNAGGKNDFTCKIWAHDRFQYVVDYFAGEIQFVQVGAAADNHVRLDGVIDLRGKTTLRELIRLVYHADGVLCGVTCLMHLATAVPVREGRPPLRPCVVIAGGRENAQWEQYPGHRYLENVGALPCCAKGGCWKSRVEKLNDGDPQDEKICEAPVILKSGQVIPRCLDMITPEEVVAHIERFHAFC